LARIAEGGLPTGVASTAFVAVWFGIARQNDGAFGASFDDRIAAAHFRCLHIS
jgi:hypothetical protein